ncbi:MAG: alpha/beta fold hydrolase [Synergistaceae bacterium]|nr:alpha/beta fold hydrolase [Synergistaceae bacterium]
MLKRVLILVFVLSLALASQALAGEQALTIDGDHGKLAAILQVPDGKESYPIVIICHGFTSQKEYLLLKTLADDLEACGIASLRFDFNGHGASDGRFEDMTLVNELSEAKKVFEYIKNNLKQVNQIALAGHSQGGVIASMTAGDLAGEIKALVLLAPAAVLKDDAIRGVNIFGVNINPLDVPEAVEIMGSNLKMGREYILTARTLQIYETARKFKNPVCLIHGTADTIVPYTYSQNYHEIYANSELNLIDGWDHGFNNHESEAAKIAANFFAKVLLK